jgi:hypothetical protein
MSYIGNGNTKNRNLFERRAEELQGWVNACLAGTSWEASVRSQYQQSIRAAVDKVRARALRGEVSWEAAAAQLQQTRNDLMELMRGQSSPVGRAVAEFLKKEGRTLNWLIARYTTDKFGKNAVFDALVPDQKDQVYAEIVSAAARSDVGVDVVIMRLGQLSRGLIVLSIAISVYEVATSTDKVHTAEREATFTASGIAGGMAGGALAGLACGPGAPVCVTLGAFVGGAMVVLGVGLIWK